MTSWNRSNRNEQTSDTHCAAGTINLALAQAAEALNADSQYLDRRIISVTWCHEELQRAYTIDNAFFASARLLNPDEFGAS